MDAVERAARAHSGRYAEETARCTRCALAEGRTQVVFGSGKPGRGSRCSWARRPGSTRISRASRSSGRPGSCSNALLEGIGLTRADVFVANVLKCRPSGNRDPLPEEIAACEPHLFRQIELIEPTIVATLGNFATKLLSGKPAGITNVHGYAQEVTVGARRVQLYPIYHPAAALYTPSMLKVLEEDFARIPALLEQAVDGPSRRRTSATRRVEPEPESVQLGLF